MNRPIHQNNPDSTPNPPQSIQVACDTPPNLQFPAQNTPKSLPKLSKGINPFTGVTGTLIAILVSLLGVYLHNAGEGDATNTVKSQYVLGVNLDPNRLHACGIGCYLVGDYTIRSEEIVTVEESLGGPGRLTRRILPWYLELIEEGGKNNYTARLPRIIPTTYTPPSNAIPLPDNLTPTVLKVQSADIKTGIVIFTNGKELQARDPEQLRGFLPDSQWLITTRPREPERIEYAYLLHNEPPIRSRGGYLDPVELSTPSGNPLAPYLTPSPPITE